MKKTISVLLAVVLMIFCSACGHEHTWSDATCEKPQICTECGETQGTALGHDWQAATCEEPETCKRCGKTQGEALGHLVKEESCTQDGTCARCGATIAAPGHDWQAATCEAPETCKRCGETQGEPLGHDIQGGVCTRCGMVAPITNNGSGDSVASDISLDDSLIYVAHFTHSGRRNFIVHSFDESGNKEYLINEIGNYDGVILLPMASSLTFNIQADGAWSYEISQIGATTDESFSGHGDFVTPLFKSTAGAWTFTHDGSSNFAVKVHTTSGRRLLVNEIGPYNGTQMVEIPSDGIAMFEITADGNWTITKN